MNIGQSITNIRHVTKRGNSTHSSKLKRRSRRRARNKLFQRLLSSRRCEHTQAQTDHEVEGQDVRCQRWCFLAHGGRSSLSGGKERHTTDQTPLGDPHREWFYIQEIGTDLYGKLVEDSAVGIVSLTVRCAGVFLLMQLGGSPTRITGCTDNFVPLRHDPARGNPMPETGSVKKPYCSNLSLKS